MNSSATLFKNQIDIVRIKTQHAFEIVLLNTFQSDLKPYRLSQPIQASVSMQKIYAFDCEKLRSGF